jgi:hypothetical protein
VVYANGSHGRESRLSRPELLLSLSISSFILTKLSGPRSRHIGFVMITRRVRSGVLTIKITGFWHVTPCNLIDECFHNEDTISLKVLGSALKMEALVSSEHWRKSINRVTYSDGVLSLLGNVFTLWEGLLLHGYCCVAANNRTNGVFHWRCPVLYKEDTTRTELSSKRPISSSSVSG